MQLMKLTLSNFKGVRSLEFEPAGRNAAVSRSLKQKAQYIAQEFYHWSVEIFREKFGKSYL